MGSTLQETTFLDHLREEKLGTQEARTKYVLNKLAYATLLLGFGSLSIEVTNVNFRWLLYLVPFVALAFDFYIMGEDYSVKRQGAFLRAHSLDPVERRWEQWASQNRDPFAPLAMPLLTTLLLLGSTVVVVSIEGTAAIVQSPWFWSWFVVSEALCWGCFAFYRSMRERVAGDARQITGGAVQPVKPVRQTIAAVEKADHQLNQAAYRQVRRLFDSCQSNPLYLQNVQQMAPEYGRREFLMCVDRQGNPVVTSEKTIADFCETVARCPDFELWFRKAERPGHDAPVLLVARWLCHLVGFRHGTVHLFIDHPTLTDHTLVQVRAVDKAESPGCFDLPAAGHAVGLESVQDTLFKELLEELGLERDALHGLTWLGGYEYCEPAGQPGFRNVEYRAVFQGRLSREGWLEVSAADDEVAAVAVFSLAELGEMIARFPERIASGLGASFPVYLNKRQA